MTAARALDEYTFGGPVSGVWLFAHRDQVHLGTFDCDDGESRTTLMLARLEQDAKFQEIRRIENDGASILAVDARVVGADMRFVLEKNQGHALEIVTSPLATLLDPTPTPPLFTPVRPIGPWPKLTDRVKLDSADLWNVADSLAPQQWLFTPRFARGGSSATLIVNTADGQALLLSEEGAPAGMLSEAALPQWLDRAPQRIVAFQRMAKPYRPFWALSRYSAPKEVPSSTLWVVEGSAVPRNLSADLKLGAVIGFALVEGPRAEPWLLALTRVAKGVVVSALVRETKGWNMAHEWPVDARSTRIEALWHGEAWHLVLAYGEPATSLHYLRRP